MSKTTVCRALGQGRENLLEARHRLIDFFIAQPPGKTGDDLCAEKMRVIDQGLPTANRLRID
jgi:hypothetical protein